MIDNTTQKLIEFFFCLSEILLIVLKELGKKADSFI